MIVNRSTVYIRVHPFCCRFCALTNVSIIAVPTGQAHFLKNHLHSSPSSAHSPKLSLSMKRSAFIWMFLMASVSLNFFHSVAHFFLTPSYFSQPHPVPPITLMTTYMAWKCQTNGGRSLSIFPLPESLYAI